MRLQAALGVVGAAAHAARVVLLAEVQLLVERQVPLDGELLVARLAPELLDADVRLQVAGQLLRRAERHVALHAQVVALMHLAAVCVPRAARVEPRLAVGARVGPDHRRRHVGRGGGGGDLGGRGRDRDRTRDGGGGQGGGDCRRHCGRGHVYDDGIVLLGVGLLPVRGELFGLVEALLALLAPERLYLGRGWPTFGPAALALALVGFAAAATVAV